MKNQSKPESCHSERSEESVFLPAPRRAHRNSRFLASLGMTSSAGSAAQHFIRFNLVGVIGVAVQLALLALLTRAFRLNYLWATGLAVALTVLHNFAWHERFTFYDRLRSGAARTLRAVAARFLKFNLLTGLISIGGNVLLMHWLCGRARLPLLAANLLAIAICGVFNYLANDRLVFRKESNTEAQRRGVAAALVVISAVIFAPCLQAQQQNITIRALDAKTGKPIQNLDLCVKSASDQGAQLKTDSAGAAIASLTTDVASLEVHVMDKSGNPWRRLPERFDCRVKPGEPAAELFTAGPFQRIPIRSILESGVVGGNRCTARSVPPRPGELALFFRRFSVGEKLSDKLLGY